MVTLFVLNATRPHLPWLIATDLLIIELPSSIGYDVLIGMDVLRSCRLLVDGPTGGFTLEF